MAMQGVTSMVVQNTSDMDIEVTLTWGMTSGDEKDDEKNIEDTKFTVAAKATHKTGEVLKDVGGGRKMKKRVRQIKGSCGDKKAAMNIQSTDNGSDYSCVVSIGDLGIVFAFPQASKSGTGV